MFDLTLFTEFSLETLPVALWAFIISQVFGLVNIGLAVYRYQLKKRDKTINIKILGNFAKLANLAFLLNFTLVGLKVISIIKNFTMKKVTKEGSRVSKRNSILLLLLFCLIKAVIVFVFWWFNGIWFEWIVLAGAIFAMAGKWQKNMHIMRLSSLVYTVAVVLNSLFFFLNFTSLLKAVFVIGSIVVFYVIFFARRGKKNSNIDKETAENPDENNVAENQAKLEVVATMEEVVETQQETENNLENAGAT
ncbi:MAG: YgjV family protein [Firmicutes bacterium]|nr:YgjV family protein [Bacillota bacterium]MCL2255656.1 YgjV family protein [Bacillota bacterium]